MLFHTCRKKVFHNKSRCKERDLLFMNHLGLISYGSVIIFASPLVGDIRDGWLISVVPKTPLFSYFGRFSSV
jgi:hypothetical protein